MRKLKEHIMKSLILRANRKRPFDIKFTERYQLPKDAPEHYNNSYYFTGFDSKNRRFLVRLAFRGDRTVETWFAYRDEKGVIYNYEKNIDEPKNGLSAGPISFKLVEEGKKWYLVFDGIVKDTVNNKEVKVKLEGHFLSNFPIYDFGTMGDPELMAKALAREKWTIKFFKDLKAHRQVHYEQFGNFEGYINIGPKKTNLSMKAVRDHSFGPRDWSYMLKHLWLIGVLEDGRCFNYSLVSYPAVKNIIAGFVWDGNQIVNVKGGTSLASFDVRKKPKNFSIEVILDKNTSPLTLECSYNDSLSWELGGVYTITEGFAEFHLDGAKGKGIAEFGFNKTEMESGRND